MHKNVRSPVFQGFVRLSKPCQGPPSKSCIRLVLHSEGERCNHAHGPEDTSQSFKKRD